jgi:hypothetical protein
MAAGKTGTISRSARSQSFPGLSAFESGGAPQVVDTGAHHLVKLEGYIMAVLRTDIERALDDLKWNEGGMKFQGLAVILAKRRWPDLIASERKSDLGADAVAKLAFAAEGGGKALACSTTASIGKIRGDAKRINDNFADISKLIFATLDTVANKRGEEWAKEIRRDFGYDLAIMEREDFVTSLMDPQNAALLGPHLGLTVAVEPDIQDRLARVRAAAAEVAAAWTRQMAARFLIRLRALRLERDGNDTDQVVGLDFIGRTLNESGRVVLEGPAGRGKTTSLIQIAHSHLASGAIAILIPLPDWAASGMPILDFIAGMPQFRSVGLSPEDLAHVIHAQHVSFLLNGWNEIGEAEFGRAERLLRGLERDFPTVGITVATRTHHIVPPLPGAMRARLLPLIRSERTAYLNARLGAKADDLRQRIETDSELDSLTRTPFVLAEVVSLFEANIPIPSTKLGVLAAVTRLVEQNDEHHNALLQPPLRGHAESYLAELARQMTAKGGVSLLEKDARLAVPVVWENLKAQGQTSTPIEPMDVLATLCSHHLLERREYPTTAFQFAHQQFQEYYASLGLEAELRKAYESSQVDDKLAFARTYLDEPGWAEPLRMIAGHLGNLATADGSPATEIGAFLITATLPLDAVFAADLARLCGEKVWARVRTRIGERLRELYAVPEQRYRELALAGMLATGSEDFKDVIVPLLSGANPQERLGTYRTWDEFHPSCLGANWMETVSQWNEQARVGFVSEFIRRRYAPDISAFVHSDSSLSVKLAAINSFGWVGADEEAANLFASLDDEALTKNISHIHLDLLPPASRSRAAATLRGVLNAQTEPEARLQTLLQLSEIGATDLALEIEEAFSKLPNELSEHHQRLVRSALDLLGPNDKDWVSAWIAVRIANGSFWGKQWIGFVRSIPEELKQQLLDRIEGEDVQQARRGDPAAVLAVVADPGMVQRLFRRLCAVRKEMLDAPDQRHELAFAVQRQTVSLLWELPPDLTLSATLRELNPEIDLVEMDALCHLFTNVGYSDHDLRGRLDLALAERLRVYVKSVMEIALAQDDFSGELKAHLASILSMVGSPEDLSDLKRLIHADLDRSRNGRAARAAGDRTRRGNGAHTTNAGVYLKAVLRLDPANGDRLIVDLLEEQEYERDISEYLVRQMALPKADAGVFQKTDYKRIWNARELNGNLLQPDRRAYFAAALKARISTVESEYAAVAEQKQKPFYEYRLRQLAGALAAVDGDGSLDTILKILSLPNEWDHHSVVNAIETLAFNGVRVPAARVVSFFDAVLNRIRKHGWQQDSWLLTRMLCLLPFLDPPERGIDALQQMVAEFHFHSRWEFRDVVQAVGDCRCEEALGFLREIGADRGRLNQLGEAWLDAVVAIDKRKSSELLLSFIDPDLPGLPDGVAFDRDDHLAAQIAQIASKDPYVKSRLVALCATDLPQHRRLLLAKIIGSFVDVDAVLAGLNLIDDAVGPPVPFEIAQQLEYAFVERRPHGTSGNTYTLEPRNSNAVRAKLFEMTSTDERRKQSSVRLLPQIEEWRLQYGRPTGEPRHPAPESGTAWPLLP